MFARATARRLTTSATPKGPCRTTQLLVGGGTLAAGAAVWCYEPTNEFVRASGAYWAAADAGAALLRDWVADAETAHSIAVAGLHHGLGPVAPAPPAAAETKVLGLTFASPVGVAAGFDKRGLAVGGLGDLGFGFVEVGGVTPQPQPGNPRPRVFRLREDESVVNFVGLPSEGCDAVAARLEAARLENPRAKIGANVTKNASTPAGPAAAADHAAVARALRGCVDFVVVNASCPNVKGGVVSVGELPAILAATRAALGPATPLLLKISPDLGAKQRAAFAKVARDARLDGLVVANTTARRPWRDADALDADAPPRLFARELASPDVPDRGGLSGPPLRANARELVADMYRRTGGRVPIVGVGGVASAEDAYALVRAGASLVQLYTALVYKGPGLAPALTDGLAKLAAADGFPSVQAAVGADHVKEKKRGWW